MIELCVEEHCHGCPEFEPSAKKEVLYGDGLVMEVQTEVVCAHQGKCESIRQYLEEREEFDNERNFQV